MVYTRFGLEVKIVKGDMTTGEATIEYKDGARREVWMGDLKADGGINEIDEAIQATQRGATH
jgi:hypothetical protein